MGETAPGEDVRAGAFSETDGVLHVQEVQHGYEVFAEGLERWEWVAEIETILLIDWLIILSMLRLSLKAILTI